MKFLYRTVLCAKIERMKWHKFLIPLDMQPQRDKILV